MGWHRLDRGGGDGSRSQHLCLFQRFSVTVLLVFDIDPVGTGAFSPHASLWVTVEAPVSVVRGVSSRVDFGRFR